MLTKHPLHIVLLSCVVGYLAKAAIPASKRIQKAEESRPLTRSRRFAQLEGKWPDGVVPYVILEQYTEAQKAKIAAAIKKLTSVTCLKIVPRTDQRNHVLIRRHHDRPDLCGTQVGMRVDDYGAHDLYLGDRCFKDNITIIHEFLHVVGFYHEHQRPDRDRYLHVFYGNVIESKMPNFLRIASSDHAQRGPYGNRVLKYGKTSTFEQPYDLRSIMHYPSSKFAKDPLTPTIVTNEGDCIPTPSQMSDLDVLKVRNFYDCPLECIDEKPPNAEGSCSLLAAEETCEQPSLQGYCKKSCDRCKYYNQ